MLKRAKIFLLLIPFILIKCSTEKNTATTRAYHNLTAHYNVYFNGKTTFDQAVEQINGKCKYDYMQILPVFPYDCPSARSIISSKMNRVMEKAAKTISRHSITVKPKYKNTRNLSPAQKEFYNKVEFCKWVDDSYLLIGKANFYKGDYSRALTTFRMILNKYKKSNIIPETKLWIAKTYIQQNRYQDAEDYLSNLENDKNFPKRLRKELYLTSADLYIKEKKYDRAIPYLEQAIKLTHKKRDKAKYTFILAQLYLKKGQKEKASELFSKVQKYNPPYELEFNAKLYKATALSQGDNPEKIKKRLLKLLKDEKNEDYQDKIYYALAQLAQNTGDTAQAIKYYRLSAIKSTEAQQKAMTYLTLADLYFKRDQYIMAGRYYDSTMQYLPNTYSDYEKIKKQSKDLIELANSYQIIKEQDSLQRLASLPKQELNSIIDSIIKAKIEAKKQQEAQNNAYTVFDYENQNYNPNQPQSQGGKWYFYNQMLVSRGQQTFRQRWGNRKLEDNWRRKNKATIAFDEENATDQKNNSETDETKREFYLKQLPLTDSLKKISDEKIIKEYFNIAQLYENKLQDPAKAIEAYETLLKRYPQNKFKQEAYYHLYLLYTEQGDRAKANKYKNRLISEFPKSKFSKILSSPGFEKKIKQQEEQAEKELWKAISLYEQNKYYEVINIANNALKKYESTSTVPSFLLLKAKAFASIGQKDSMRTNLNLIIKDFPETEQAKFAKEILAQEAKIKQDLNLYKYDPQQEHYIIFVSKDPQEVNTYKFLLFKYANEFNDKKDYKAQIESLGNQKMVILSTFDNKTEAVNFIKFLQSRRVKTDNLYLITKDNLEVFKKDKDIKKYKMFYDLNYKL